MQGKSSQTARPLPQQLEACEIEREALGFLMSGGLLPTITHWPAHLRECSVPMAPFGPRHPPTQLMRVVRGCRPTRREVGF